jgi:cytochrome c oxidase assembly protein subunit 11
VLPGETALAFYTAKNVGDKDLIGIATYNMTPEKVGLTTKRDDAVGS